jgi:hypothetical protein
MAEADFQSENIFRILEVAKLKVILAKNEYSYTVNRCQ